MEGREISRIGRGILTFLGVAKGDTEETLRKLIAKICEMRIFEDGQGKMNLALKDVAGEHLIVSQFTLLGDCAKGRRPSFVDAEAPERAKELYEKALTMSSALGVPTRGGVFQAHMDIELTNGGPVTLILALD